MIGIQRSQLNADENAFYYKMASYKNAYMVITLIKKTIVHGAEFTTAMTRPGDESK